jgi:hypothetical protein
MMYRSIIASASFAALLITPMAQAATAQTRFSDVPASDTSADAIYDLRNRGVVEGYSDGTFRPKTTINRAEFTKIVIGAKFSQDEIQKCLTVSTFLYPGVFKDVEAGAWYVPHLCLAVGHSIIGGYGDGTFGGEKTINYAEASKIIVETFKVPLSDNVPGEQWWQMYVTAMEGNNLLPASYHSASQLVTRGEMSFMISAALKVSEGGASSQGAFVGQGCKVSGCSAQYCQNAGEEDMMSTCEWTAAYQCYQSARCEKQDSGSCGWSQTSDLKACLANAK